MAHISQSRPDFGLGFQVKVSKICYLAEDGHDDVAVLGRELFSSSLLLSSLELSDARVYEP